MRQCLGGWCTLRDRCPHYAAEPGPMPPAERLCMPGEEREQIARAHAEPRSWWIEQEPTWAQ